MTRTSLLATAALLVSVAACSAPPPAPEATERPAETPPIPVPAPRPPAEPVTQAETTTDERGRFQVRNLAAGAYNVAFGTPGSRGFTQVDGVQVNATYGANLTDLRLESGASETLGSDEYQPNKLPFVIRGNVVNGRGEPVPGVAVRVARR
jgi:hypothetical protein